VIGAGDLPKCILHISGADTAASARVDVERATDPRSAGVQATTASQLVRAL